MIWKNKLAHIPKMPEKIGTDGYIAREAEIREWMLAEAPVAQTKISVMNAVFVAPYAGCKELLTSPKFMRVRKNATGGKGLSIPLPKSIALMMQGMILQDDPNHKRQRTLVAKAFTPKALNAMTARIDELTDELIKGFAGRREIDLLKEYATPIPVTIIREMVGVSEVDMPRFQDGLKYMTEGFSGVAIVKTVMHGMPKLIALVRELIEAKRLEPGDDILSGLIAAEEAGDKLSNDELVAMVFTLILAGYETTMHLIANGVITLLEHPEQLQLLREEPARIDDALEEVLRFSGPVEGTKQAYATEDLELCGVLIPKGTMVLPNLAAANRDPSVFENPNVFDIARKRVRNLSFGHGAHHCLGAALARMETKIAINKLIAAYPELALAKPRSELKRQILPAWHRYDSVPVRLR